MDWKIIGGRIRRQREFLGYTREQFSELLDVTPKFCSDIELGVKGMSVQTLCRISEVSAAVHGLHPLWQRGRREFQSHRPVAPQLFAG